MYKPTAAVNISATSKQTCVETCRNHRSLMISAWFWSIPTYQLRPTARQLLCRVYALWAVRRPAKNVAWSRRMKATFRGKQHKTTIQWYTLKYLEFTGQKWDMLNMFDMRLFQTLGPCSKPDVMCPMHMSWCVVTLFVCQVGRIFFSAFTQVWAPNLGSARVFFFCRCSLYFFVFLCVLFGIF